MTLDIPTDYVKNEFDVPIVKRLLCNLKHYTKGCYKQIDVLGKPDCLYMEKLCLYHSATAYLLENCNCVVEEGDTAAFQSLEADYFEILNIWLQDYCSK